MGMNKITHGLPEWLFLKRISPYDVTLRFGSRRPLRVCLTIFKDAEKSSAYPMPTAYLFCIGRFGLQWGPEDGILEGQGGLPRGSKSHAWFRQGMALGITWEAAP